MTNEKRAITADDINKIITLEDPQLSPDGQWVAYVHVAPNPMEKGYTRNIWLAATDGSRTLQLTRGGKDSAPRWSPDGRTLAFVSGRAGKPQIFLLPVTAPGGEPRPLTSNVNGAGSPAWSSDGAHIAYLSGMTIDEMAKEDRGEKPLKPADSLAGKHQKERQEEDEKNRFDPRFVTRTPYRQGTTFIDERFQQIYIIPTADGLEGDAAAPRRLTKTHVSYGAPEWSPDGRFIYSVRAKNIEADEPWRENNLFKLQVSDGDETQLVDAGHYVNEPQVAPDGTMVAATRNIYNTTDHLGRLSLYPATGGKPVDLNLELDRNIVFYRWTAENELIVAVATEGDHHLYHVGESYTFIPLETETQHIQGLSVSPYGSIAYVASSPENPSELFFRATDRAERVQLTHVNQKFLDEVTIQPTHEMRFTTPSGREIQAWYMLPAGYEAGKKYPLALNIHGGPHVMWGAGMQSMWHEWQYHAAQGYVAFWCNPRGSDGYGEEFIHGLHAAWGPHATEDVLTGVDALVQKGLIDTDHMAVTGGSYGGYLTAWIIAHDHRFKCAVAQRGVYNLLSFYGTSDVPLLISNEFDAHPWEDPTRLWEHSPVAHAHKIQTPLLIIHSENDFRVPIEQGEQLFGYVRKVGGVVKMVRFPREGHELTRAGEPTHRIASLTEMVKWFDAYCQPEKQETI
jgi:dipeptidyl aminopeptidase/acylaminoacyl peptidase